MADLPVEFQVTHPNIDPAPITDPELASVAMGERVMLGEGYWEQTQKYDAADVTPSGGQSTITAEEMDEIIRKHPGLVNVIHWGNLSRSGTGLSAAFVDAHADKLDWNLLCLYAPLTPEIVTKHIKRINPHLLMKNPHLKDALLEAVADRLDMDRIVRELKISSDFARRNREVLNPYDLMKYQQLDSAFWLEVLNDYRDLKSLPQFAQEIVRSQNNLDVTFARGIVDLQNKITTQAARDPSLGLPIPFRILDGTLLIEKVKIDPGFIRSLLANPYNPEHRAKLKKDLAVFQTLPEDVLIQYYSSPADLNDLPMAMALLQHQTLPASMLQALAPMIMSNPKLIQATAMRQKLNTEQIRALVGACSQRDQFCTICILMRRALYPENDPQYLVIEPEILKGLQSHVSWASAFDYAPLSSGQVANAILRIPEHLVWKAFVIKYREHITEELIIKAHEQGCIGPLEWVLLLTTEHNGKLIRNTKFSEAFLSAHGDRFYWWKYTDPKGLPFSMMNSRIPRTDAAREYVLTQARVIIRDFVAAADWVVILRDEQLPLWFIDGISSNASHIDMFWWKIIRYQSLSPEFIRDHAADLADTNVFVKYQLRRLLIKYGDEPVKSWLRNYYAFLEEDALEFINKDNALRDLYHAAINEAAKVDVTTHPKVESAPVYGSIMSFISSPLDIMKVEPAPNRDGNQ